MEVNKIYKDQAETTQSFSLKREPLQQTKTNNTPYIAQIQESYATLIRKRNEYRQLKMMESNLKAKGEEQELRIESLQIQMDHQITKEENDRYKLGKLDKQHFWYKETVRQLLKELQLIKIQMKDNQYASDQLSKKIQKSRNKIKQITEQISEKQQQQQSLQEQIINLEQILTKNQNSVRQKQDELTNLKIQEAQMTSVLEYLKQRAMMTMKARNNVIAENKLIDKEMSAIQIKNIKFQKQIDQVSWNAQQLEKDNEQVDELNQKLLEDLEGVQKHLLMIEKTNKILRDSLQQFGMTGQKVQRMINMVKSDS